MSPETTLLTPRAEHPPGESGREKSRAALIWKKVTLTNVHLPSFSRSDARGSLYPPARVPAPVPRQKGSERHNPARRPGLPVAAGQRDGDGASPEPTAQNLLLRSHLQARQGKLMPPRPLVCHRHSRATESILSRRSTPKLGSRTGNITRQVLQPTRGKRNAGQATAPIPLCPQGLESRRAGSRAGSARRGCRGSAYLSARLQKSRMAGMAAYPGFSQGAGGDLVAPGQAQPPVPVLDGSRRQPGSNVMTTRNESSPPRAPTRTARLPLPTDSPTGVPAPAWGRG